MKPGYKYRLLLSIILVFAICWIDYQYFTELPMAASVPDPVRKFFHFFVLIILIPVGYWGWNNHPQQWIKKIWLIAYIFSIAVMLILGLIEWKFKVFNIHFLKDVGDFRLFFSSPVPFFILYALSLTSKNVTPRENSKKI